MLKKILYITAVLMLLLTDSTVFSKAVSEKNTINRYAFIVGANNGGSDRIKLKYAVSDAGSVMKIFNKMGGIKHSNTKIMIEPDRKSFLTGINRMYKKINREKSSSSRIEVLFYYSGHSDEEGILLGGEKVYYTEISRTIKKMPADVRIAILDSCSSGAFTRLKGGKKKAPFQVDASNNMKGFAFMTSSSADEASQESDRIKGSFFTHYLVSGLRGAADMSQDGRITLNEAYQFAYTGTLARTEKTVHGAQHPNYNIQMTGTGDVVMTDIRKSSSVMVIDKNISGRLFIRDDRGNLVAEIRKPSGKKIQLGLEQGSYSITNKKDKNLFEASVEIAEGKNILLAAKDFKSVSGESTVARGGNYKTVVFHTALFPDFSRENTIFNYSLSFFGDYCTVLDGAAISLLGVTLVKEDVTGAQISLIGNRAGHNFKGFQGSLISNITGGKMKGCQASAGFNYAGADAKGMQLASIFNMTGGNFSGSQNAACFNHVRGDVKGIQSSAVFNYTGGSVKGAQLSACINIAKKISGAQISCLNIAEESKGAQIGIVNISKKYSGLQLGLVNYTEDSEGLPIGLVNIVKNGETHADIWWEETGLFKIAIKHGTKRVYGIYSLGVDKTADNISFGLGTGTSFKFDKFFINFDVTANNIKRSKKLFTESDSVFHAEARLYCGYKIFKHLAVFGGVSYNYASNFGEDSAASFKPLYDKAWGTEDHSHWPGFFFGVQM